ncbi:quinoprotein relay system zinc metallohydrolase 2 [Piscinibacter sakaiensis]|uniref:Zn-dependent hydrolase n=1 Tax=Piscinibacter sakaiensis TaxID=1547922 RepID=A0A0K8NUI2_PISS1|nr:quinoprotein relay system zinc metallohydrolase 2 [Piscinibacter sakaiensis]GAP33929.1 Zn-dependent hydrolase [Piscinibacter sakaiensis]
MRMWAWALVGVAGLVGAGAGAQTPAGAGEAPLALRALAPGVWVHEGAVAAWGEGGAQDVANLGVVVGSRCVAVIDSGGSVGVGRRLRAAIAAITDRPVCYLVMTHGHPDHVFGHAAFDGAGPGGSDPQRIGHARAPAALATRGRAYLEAVRRSGAPDAAEARLLPPTRTVAPNEPLELPLGGGPVLRLQAWPTAHTDHDLSVAELASRTLFVGDLVFADHLPVLDGSLRGWLRVMQALPLAEADWVVPGHGAPSRDWPALAAPQRRYLERLQQSVREALQARRTLRETVEALSAGAEGGPWPGGGPAEAWSLVEAFHRRNLTAAYAELEWE